MPPAQEVVMKFSELLLDAIRQSEIPVRFEPGAEEAVALPVTEILKSWIAAHDPDPARGDFEYGQKALVVQLLEELEDDVDLPVVEL
jgi:hypothetical protein